MLRKYSDKAGRTFDFKRRCTGQAAASRVCCLLCVDLDAKYLNGRRPAMSWFEDCPALSTIHPSTTQQFNLSPETSHVYEETLESTASGWLSDLESRSIENVVSKWTEDIHYAVHPDTNGIYPMNREQ